MAYYDLEEQEQISELKAWWQRWGALMLLAVALGLGAIAAYQGWTWYKRDTAAKAAAVYAALMQAEEQGNAKKVTESAALLADKYARTGYAPLGALLAARVSFDQGDVATARQHLQWVVDNARDEDLKNVAKYRLASIYLDEKRYDDALRLLDAQPEAPIANLYADLRGDVHLAKGAVAEARAAYQSALEKTDTKSPYRNLIQIKIDALGDAK